MMIDVSAAVRHLNELGYAIVRDALAPEFCDEIVAEIERLERTRAHRLVPNDFSGHNTVRYFALLNPGEVWQRVADHPNVIPISRGVLGEDMLLSTMGTAVIGPDEPAQPIHRDDSLYDLAMPHRQIVCQTMLALTDFTE